MKGKKVPKLSPYQQEILARLAKGGILSTTHLGPFTQSPHFRGDPQGINGATMDKLRRLGLIQKTDKMTMHGLVAFYHLPNTTPWKKDDSYQSYQKWKFRH